MGPGVAGALGGRMVGVGVGVDVLVAPEPIEGAGDALLLASPGLTGVPLGSGVDSGSGGAAASPRLSVGPAAGLGDGVGLGLGLGLGVAGGFLQGAAGAGARTKPPRNASITSRSGSRGAAGAGAHAPPPLLSLAPEEGASPSSQPSPPLASPGFL